MTVRINKSKLYGFLSNLVRSRWLDIGHVLLLCVYGPTQSKNNEANIHSSSPNNFHFLTLAESIRKCSDFERRKAVKAVASLISIVFNSPLTDHRNFKGNFKL